MSQRDVVKRLLQPQAHPGAAAPVVLVACAKSKLKRPAPAHELYISQTVRKSVQLAQLLELRFYIISAKHGLLSPHCVIAPYDVTLRSFDEGQAKAWGNDVAAVLERVSESSHPILILGSKHYASPIIEALGGGREVLAPIAGISIGRMNEWLSIAVRSAQRRQTVSSIYKLLEKASERHSLPTLKELLKRRDLPTQGVYFFFDEAEPTRFSVSLPRIVRIGTHAVSAGSRTTLRQRLRTHLGPEHGGGNHRGSVFRLHVGAAIIEREGLQKKYPNWGVGQSADEAIRKREAPLEKRVSDYIGKLRLALVEISDVAGPMSVRSFIEKNSVAALTADEIPVDPPSSSWLGQHSVKPQIRETGLWNIQHVGSQVQGKYIGALEKFVCAENLLI